MPNFVEHVCYKTHKTKQALENAVFKRSPSYVELHFVQIKNYTDNQAGMSSFKKYIFHKFSMRWFEKYSLFGILPSFWLFNWEFNGKRTALTQLAFDGD